MKKKNLGILMVGILCLSVSELSFSSVKKCPLDKEMKPWQWENILAAYNRGKPHDLGYTLASIAIVETKAGLDTSNDDSESYGITQILLTTAEKRLRDKGITSTRESIKQQLLSNDNFSYDLAIEELNYWNEIRDSNWRNMVRSYNAGWKQYKGEPYLRKVINRLNQLKQCDLEARSLKTTQSN